MGEDFLSIHTREPFCAPDCDGEVRCRPIPKAAGQARESGSFCILVGAGHGVPVDVIAGAFEGARGLSAPALAKALADQMFSAASPDAGSRAINARISRIERGVSADNPLGYEPTTAGSRWQRNVPGGQQPGASTISGKTPRATAAF